MLSPFRFAGIITVFFAVWGSARAQEPAPAGSGPSVHKMVIDSGARTVRYFVTGGSARLQALVRRVEWAENELSVIEQLQLFKLDTVVNERRLAAFRTERLTNPYYPPDCIPYSIAPVNGGDAASPLQRALTRQLAYQATPQSALQLIGLLEQFQTELDAELKALPAQEKNAVQAPVDDLRKRVAALPRSDVPPPRTEPVMPQRLLQGAPPAPAPAVAKAAVEVKWGSSWWAAEVLQVNGSLSLIHYTGWGSSSDEWVTPERIRPTGTVSAPHQFPMPQDPVALEQMVHQNQEGLRQQVMQMQQQITQQYRLVNMALQR
jgi:hypothetical protein